MSKEQLKHIFEPSACLSPRQLKGYATGKMVHEECHAVEVHLLSCPFCSDALEGIMSAKNPAAIAGMEKLDDSFIAKHFGVSNQEIKQVTKTKPVIKAGAYSTEPEKKEKKAVHIPWKPLSLAASLVVAVCIMWFMRDSIFPKGDNDQLAEQVTVTPEPEPEVVYRPLEDSNAVAMGDTVATPAQDAIADIVEPGVETATEMATEAKPEKLVAVPSKDSIAKALAAKKEADKKLAETKLAAAKKAEEDKKKLVATVDKPVNTKTSLVADEPARAGNSYGPTVTSEYSSKNTTQPKAAETAEPEKKKIELGTARSGIPKGDEAFNEGKYKKALKLYQKVMYDPESNQKDAATFMAAKCHIAMDEKMQARTLLNSLIQENSTKKGEAQSLLNQVGE
ncbi:MAG: tetratricopeptide repeat protein [Chitinophagaceae bacterium]|nr:tetratricopeptide repeat protein [Chitinophagaceae bacterium]MCB9047101.1 tetratricopeptide repeat protein [Chitinophagales bacterium]